MAEDPLSSKQAMAAFLQRARAAGKTDAEIEAFVQAKLSGARKQTYPFGEAPPTETNFNPVAPGKIEYGTREEGVESMTGEQFSKGLRKFTVGNVLPIATMEAAPLLLPAKLAARPLLGMAAKIGLRSGGAGAGSEASHVIEGEKPSLKRGLETARNVAIAEGVVRVPAYAMGRAGGVEPAAASLAQDNPKLLKPVHAREYASAVEDISKTNIPLTPEHMAYQTLVENRGPIDGMKYVDRILKKVRPGVDEPTARLIESKTGSLADRLFQRLGPDGKISARDLDDWLRVNVSEPAARVYEKGAGTAWQERLADLRDDLTPRFYGDVGPEAAGLQRATSGVLKKEAAGKSMFPEPTPTRMNLQSPSYLRQVLKDTDLGEQVRTRLAGLDEIAGTKHLPRVQELAMRSSWTAAEKAEVEDILANIPAIAYERVGLVRAGARKVGRGLTRAARPTGRVAAVGSTIRGVSQ